MCIFIDAEFKQRQGVIMKRKIAIAFLTMAINSTLYADNVSVSKGFVGLEVSGTKLQSDVVGFYQENNYVGQNAEYGFRIGAKNENWRTMFIFNYFDSEDDNQNYEKGLFELDYSLASMGSDTVTFNPFIGLNAGYMNYESDGGGITNNIEESGFLYGGQAGFIVNFNNTVDLDLMYRYSLIDTQHTDHIESIVVGLSYIF